jgi:hypothetical protein
MSKPQAIKDQILRELVLYIAQRSKNDANFGAAKQNKLLLYADLLAYANLGEPITHQEYVTVPKGAAPKRWPLVMKQMIAKGDIADRQRRTVPLRDANLSLFSPSQINLVDQLIEMHRQPANSP